MRIRQSRQALIEKMVPIFTGQCAEVDDFIQIVDIAYGAVGAPDPEQFNVLIKGRIQKS